MLFGLPFRPGDRILTCLHEYGSNVIAFMQVGSALQQDLLALTLPQAQARVS